jgi:hypothetical protein
MHGFTRLSRPARARRDQPGLLSAAWQSPQAARGFAVNARNSGSVSARVVSSAMFEALPA